MLGRMTMEAVHLIRRFIELLMDRDEDFHMVFIGIEKSYDRIPCEVSWRYLQKKKVLVTYIGVTKDMYYEFPIDVRIREGSTLRSFLFTSVMDKLTKEILNEIL